MSRAGETIFIIDDDESVRRALGRLIQSAGLNVETFATAEEFLQYPERPEPGCLILDLHLPGLCGLELQERLKAEGRCVPLVFISGDTDERARARALRAGAVAFLHKPFEEQELLGAVRRAVG
jgi:FixJ family two-component response regulator